MAFQSGVNVVGDGMAQPEYSQQEADDMLGMAKRVAFEALMYGAPLRETVGESACAFDALPEETAAGAVVAIKFKIEVRKNEEVNAYAILLGGSIGNRKMQALCRYDVHDTLHPNGICCPTRDEIEPGVFHVHRYSEACIRVGRSWDACALPLIVPQPRSGKGQLRQLIGEFVKDMRIRFSDKGTHQDLFETGET
jgi:hypothetical protein